MDQYIWVIGGSADIGLTGNQVDDPGSKSVELIDTITKSITLNYNVALAPQEAALFVTPYRGTLRGRSYIFSFGGYQTYDSPGSMDDDITRSNLLLQVSDEPTPSPTPAPTNAPTPVPTISPTPSPTPAPTNSPTPAPTNSPTPAPSNLPTSSPTPAPTNSPTPSPTPAPTDSPTNSPTPSPTPGPTNSPTPSPTNSPSPAPSNSPSPAPTSAPTTSPTPGPTNSPSPAPTLSPTPSPTVSPSPGPTNAPTPSPTDVPSITPTTTPSKAPTTPPTLGRCDYNFKSNLIFLIDYSCGTGIRSCNERFKFINTIYKSVYNPKLSMTILKYSNTTSNNTDIIMSAQAPTSYFDITDQLQQIDMNLHCRDDVLSNEKSLSYGIEKAITMFNDNEYNTLVILNYCKTYSQTTNYCDMYPILKSKDIEIIPINIANKNPESVSDENDFSCLVPNKEPPQTFFVQFTNQDEKLDSVLYSVINPLCQTRMPTSFTKSPTQNPSSSPTQMPTDAPTGTPTVKPTDNPVLPGENFGESPDTEDPKFTFSSFFESSNYTTYVMVVILGISLFITILGFFHAKQLFCGKLKTGDSDSLVAFMLFGIRINDVFTDISVCIIIWNNYINNINHEYSLYYLILAIGSAVFLIVPYIANVINASKTKSKKFLNKIRVQEYFSQNSLIFLIIALLTGDAYVTLQVTNSKLFAINKLDLGITDYDFRHMKTMKIVYVVLLENFPQLIIQITYTILTSVANPTVILGFIFSALSSVVVTLEYCMNSGGLSHADVVSVYLQGTVISDQTNTTTQDEIIEKLDQKKGYRKCVREQIAKITNYKESNVLIGYIDVDPDSFLIHIVHYIVKSKTWDKKKSLTLNDDGNISNDNDDEIDIKQFIEQHYSKQSVTDVLVKWLKEHFEFDDTIDLELKITTSNDKGLQTVSLHSIKSTSTKSVSPNNKDAISIVITSPTTLEDNTSMELVPLKVTSSNNSNNSAENGDYISDMDIPAVPHVKNVNQTETKIGGDEGEIDSENVKHTVNNESQEANAGIETKPNTTGNNNIVKSNTNDPQNTNDSNSTKKNGENDKKIKPKKKNKKKSKKKKNKH